jgi:hypothetical protein
VQRPSASVSMLATFARPEIMWTRARGSAPPVPASSSTPRSVRLDIRAVGEGCCASIGAAAQVSKSARNARRIASSILTPTLPLRPGGRRRVACRCGGCHRRTSATDLPRGGLEAYRGEKQAVALRTTESLRESEPDDR